MKIELIDFKFTMSKDVDSLDNAMIYLVAYIKNPSGTFLRKIFVNEEEIASLTDGLLFKRLNNKVMMWLDKFIEESLYSPGK
jgi:hypothetical protein